MPWKRISFSLSLAASEDEGFDLVREVGVEVLSLLLEVGIEVDLLAFRRASS